MKVQSLAIAAVLLTAALVHATEWEDYAAAERSLGAGDCASAVAALSRAIAVDGKESDRKNSYGMHFDRYLPHLLLARAHICQGDGDLALAELLESERQGVAEAETIRDLRARVKELDGGASELVWRAREALRTGDLLWAQGLVEQALARAPEHRGGKEVATRIARALRLERLLAEARILAGQGDADGARRRAEEALLLEPGNTDAERIARVARDEIARRAAAPPATVPSTQAPVSRPTTAPASPAAVRADAGEELDALLREARAYLRVGQLSRAVGVATRAAALEGDRQEVEGLLGEIAKEMARASAGATESGSEAAIRRSFFREAVRAYHQGLYDDALARLAVAERAMHGAAELHFYRGAALLAKHFLGGSRDAALAHQARLQFALARGADPAYAPGADDFSPRILEVFASSGVPPLLPALPGPDGTAP